MDGISTMVLGVSLIIIMLGMGLSLTLDDFKRIFVYPKAVLVGITNQILILPIVGFLLVSVFSLPSDIAIGIMILAACPGGATSNLICHLAKGDIALSVTLTALSSFITILTIPFVVNFSLEYFLDQGQVIKLDIVKTIIQVLSITVIPVGIGMIVRRYKENFAMKMERPVRIASGIVMAVVIIGIVVKEQESLIVGFKEAGLVSICLNLITMLIGYFSAKLFRITTKRSISIAIESGIQNGTLAISIAVVLLENSAFALAPAVYSLLMFLSGAVIVYLGVKRDKKEA